MRREKIKNKVIYFKEGELFYFNPIVEISSESSDQEYY